MHSCFVNPIWLYYYQIAIAIVSCMHEITGGRPATLAGSLPQTVQYVAVDTLEITCLASVYLGIMQEQVLAHIHDVLDCTGGS